MCLVLIFFLCAAIIERFDVPNNSRFGTINSRLGRFEFPFDPLRELIRKALIQRVFFGAETALIGQNRKNSRFHGNNREWIETAKLVGG
jgi:hypothetical protein